MTPAHVEFLGLPGAGKSTLAAPLAEGLQAAGYRLVDRMALARSYDALSSFAKAPFYLPWHRGRWPRVAATLGYALATRPVTLERLRRSAKLLRLRAQLERVPGAPCDLIVLDQGLSQALASLVMAGTAPEARLDALLTALYRGLAPHVLYLQLEPRTALARLRGRRDGKSRFDALPDARAARLLGDQANYQRALVVHLRALGIPLLTIDATRDREENAAAALRWLRCRLGSSAHGRLAAEAAS